VAASSGKTLASGMRAIPFHQDLSGLVQANPMAAPSSDQVERERRILYAYSEMLSGGCCQGACRPKARG